MFKSIIIKYAKKYIVSAINDLLNKNKDNIHTIVTTIGLWIQRLDKILQCLKNILTRVSDGQIDDKEIEDSKTEIETIISNWTVK